MLRLFLCLTLFLGGLNTAQAAFFSDDEARQKIGEQQKQITQLTTQLQGLQVKLDEEQKLRAAAETRINGLEGQLRGQVMLDLLNQIERLNTEISQMKGQMEVMAHELEATQKRQRDLYTDLDSRLRKLEETPAAAAPPATPATPPAEAAPQTPASQPTSAEQAPAPATPPAPSVEQADGAAETKAYETAYATYKAGKHGDAVNGFKQFVENYPNSKLVPNAYYWMGAAQFSLKDYKSAIATQQKLVKQFPSHDKAADGMYSIANSQIQLSDVDGAKQTLKSLIAKYPSSRIVDTAKKRLTALESMGSKK